LFIDELFFRDRLHQVYSMWEELVESTNRKGAKLKEAGDQQQFNRNIEDIELWLSELEGQTASEDFGKDLISVQNLQKKQALIESDFNAHQERIDAVGQQANNFEQMGHFDAPTIRKKENTLLTRYTHLRDPLQHRKNKLSESLRGHQLFRDIEDELAWIREKDQVAGSTNRGTPFFSCPKPVSSLTIDRSGRDLIGVQNLIKKHQALSAEINNHEPQIDAVAAGAEEMIQQGHFLAPEIRDKLAQLRDNWRSLKGKADKRRQDLDDSLQV
jgi:spectrin alpha